MGGHYQSIIKIKVWYVLKARSLEGTLQLLRVHKRSHCMCLSRVQMCIFIDNTCYFLLSGFDPQKQVLECLESCDQDVSPKLNASSGSNQKGHSVGGRGRESLCENGRLKSDCFTRGRHTHMENRSINTKSCWLRKKVSFSNQSP